MKKRIKKMLICVLFGLGMMGLTQQVKAEMITVSSYEDIVPDAGASGGRSVDYQTFNLQYDGATPTDKIILFATYWNGSGYVNGGGGLNSNYPGNPGQAFGHFNQRDATYMGLASGESPDTWYGGVDLNGDGNIGQYDNQTGKWTMDPGEGLYWHQVLAVGFTPFPSSGVGPESIGTIKIRSQAATFFTAAGWSNGLPTANNNAYFSGVDSTCDGDFAAAALLVGDWNSATFRQSDGIVTTEDLILGVERDGGNGTYEMNGGILNVADGVYVGRNGNGTFLQNGTTVTIGGDLYIGGYAGSTGTYTMSSGTLDVRNGNIYVGLAGTGTLDVNTWTVWADEVVLGDNGTFTTGSYARLRVNQLTGFFENGVSTFGQLQIGHSGGRGEANFVMPGGLDLAMKSFTIGYDAKGTFIQDHGTIALNDSLYVGQEAGGDGTYELSGTGQLDVDNGFNVGSHAGGVGTFRQNGGNVHASHVLQVYSGSQYELNAGQCIVRDIVIQGDFNQAGGSVQIGGGWFGLSIGEGGTYTLSDGTLNIAGDIQGGSGSSEFILDGGTLNLDGEIDSIDTFIVGKNVSASFTQTGGTNTVGSLLLGHGGHMFNSGSSGTYTISGGTLTTGTLSVGNDGNGFLNIINNGTVNSDIAYIGRWFGSTGVVTIDGAGSTWDARGWIGIGASGGTGTLNITNGGEVQSESIFVGEAGKIHFNEGTLNTNGLEAGVVDLTGTGIINTHGLVSDVDLVFDSLASLNQTLTLNSQPDQNITLNLDISGSDVPVLGAGHKGTGSIMIQNGITIKSTSGQIACFSGSTGVVTVDGIGSTWDAGWLNVGDGGNGTLNIINNGSVNSDKAYIGRWPGSMGVVRIDGTGSIWTNRYDLDVGEGGSGVLNITNGGLVSVAGTLAIDLYGYGGDSFINIAGGGMLGLLGDADNSLLAFLGLIDGTDAIRYWDESVLGWADITNATYGDDYMLSYMTEGDLAGYTILTVTATPEPATMGLLALGGLAMLRRRKC